MARQTILTPNQKKILNALGEEKMITERFYLTGGTALAEFYLRHRYSEDLDFFSEEEVDTQGVFAALKKIKQRTGINKIDFEQSFNRNLFFLQLKNEIIKTEFTYFPFPRAERGKTIGRLAVDSLSDIAINKLFTIYQKPRARDFVDLYLIVKQEKIALAALIAKAKIKFDWHIDPLQLGARFLEAKEVKDYPRMLKKISDKKWQNFFLKEARALRKEVLE